ncbi:MAG: PAS domain-containing protein, partial [Deltaproteobacteria bacterium]|nr:PAS domain-containing protein [Deltaproteobacteria bacterium]
MNMKWGADQVQSLLEATANQSGILYLIVTDRNGRILAANRRTLIGKIYLNRHVIAGLHPDSKAQWRLSDYDKRNSFEVYRLFLPWKRAAESAAAEAVMKACSPGERAARENTWCFPSIRPEAEKIIFVGLDMEPFEAARMEDMRNTIVISLILLILGLGGLFSMFLAHRYRSTSRMLRDTSALANEVVSNLPVGLMVMGSDGRIAFINQAAEKITGIKLDEALGKVPGQIFPLEISTIIDDFPGNKTILEQDLECTFSGEHTTSLSVTASRIVNRAGDLVAGILILRDLIEVRKLQEEVRRKEKLAALGGLAAGIAHEIRNPLSSIKGLASFFGSKFPEGSEDREAATVMISEVDRLNRVISELLEFARPSELKLKPTDLNQLLEHSVRLVRQDAETKGIVINLTKDEPLPEALLDPDRFSQCLLNLYLNAIQAMEEGGRLSVKSIVGPKRTLQITVADTGKGIERHGVTKIFDPYFTTKPTGTGLGLAIVHKIVEAHEGLIEVKSKPGQGTEFTISIPAAFHKAMDKGSSI